MASEALVTRWGWPARCGRAEVSDGGPGGFGCPVCGGWVEWSGASDDRVATCQRCEAVVVAPQPEFGCRAMRYRDWLRMQELDAVGDAAAVGAAAADASWRVTTPVMAVTPRGVVVTAACGLMVVGLGVVVAMVVRSGSTGDLVVAGTSQLAGEWGGDAGLAAELPSFPAAPVAPDVTRAVPAGMDSLTALAQRDGLEGATVLASAARSRSFAATAPADDAFLCLKLTDPAAADVSLRVYLPRAGELEAQADSLLPWGRTCPVTVRLRWQPADTIVEGHWQVVSLEPANSAALPPPPLPGGEIP